MSSLAWRELLGNAIAGASRQPGAASDGKSLSSAAVLATMAKAGFKPETSNVYVPECPPESRPVCDESVDHLRQCFQNSPDLVQQWVGAAGSEGVLAPPQALPQLLEWAVKSASNRAAAWRVIGARGRWLARLNPAWAEVMQEDLPPEKLWSEASVPVRTLLLRRLVQADAALARELLSSTWSTEAASERVSFLRILGTCVQPSDESFLNSCRTDRSTEVRLLATQFLSMLPGSAVSVEAKETVFRLVRLKKSLLARTLEIELPTGVEPQGVLPGGPSTLGVRQKALAQLIALIPPSEWEKRFGERPGALLAMSRGHEFRSSLLAGWAAAAEWYGNREWATQVVSEWLQTPVEWQLSSGLVELVPDKPFDEFVSRLMEKEGAAFYLLLHRRKAWSPDLTRIALSAAADSRGAVNFDDIVGPVHPEAALSVFLSARHDFKGKLEHWKEIVILRRDMVETIRRCART